eukprot:scaffold96972_cov15-Tisochrysis_lutea.AAC.2
MPKPARRQVGGLWCEERGKVRAVQNKAAARLHLQCQSATPPSKAPNNLLLVVPQLTSHLRVNSWTHLCGCTSSAAATLAASSPAARACASPSAPA